MTSWHNTDIHTNTVRTNFNHFSTLPQNLVLLWWILFENYLFKHSNPISSVVSEIKSGVRESYAAEKVGTLKVKLSLWIIVCLIIVVWKREREKTNTSQYKSAGTASRLSRPLHDSRSTHTVENSTGRPLRFIHNMQISIGQQLKSQAFVTYLFYCCFFKKRICKSDSRN